MPCRTWSNVECSGRLAGDFSMNAVTVRYDGKRRHVVSAARTPWGTFEVVGESFTSGGGIRSCPLLRRR